MFVLRQCDPDKEEKGFFVIYIPSQTKSSTNPIDAEDEKLGGEEGEGTERAPSEEGGSR